MACKQNVHLRYTCLVFCSWSKGKSLSHAVERHLWCSTWSPVQTEGKSQCGVETTVRLPLNEMFPPNQEQQSFILSVISWLSASFCSDLPPKSPCVSLSTIHHLGSKMRSHCITSQPVFLLSVLQHLSVPTPLVLFSQPPCLQQNPSHKGREFVFFSTPLLPRSVPGDRKDALRIYAEEGTDRQGDRKKASLQSILSVQLEWASLISFYLFLSFAVYCSSVYTQ